VFRAARYYRIGIVHEGKLQAQFTMAPVSAGLDAHVERLRRYWALNGKHIPFPGVIYCIGPSSQFQDASCVQDIRFCDPGLSEPDSESEAAAAGAACAAVSPQVPVFARWERHAVARRFRTAVYGTSAAVICAAVVGLTVPPVMKAWYGARYRTLHTAYRRHVQENEKTRTLLTRTEELARDVMRLETMTGTGGGWAALLDTLAYVCARGCFIDKLESTALDSTGYDTHLHFAGWTRNEETVAEMIGVLQRIPMIHDIRLESMGRHPEKESITRFTIQCDVSLSTR
jgi:Tfp pilus assembly protein PilN